VRHRVNIEYFLHAGHKLGVGLWRNYPVFDLAVGHPVFLSVRRMVSWLMESTISSSTTLRANNRNVQLAYPFGAGPNRIAMILASCSPVSSFGVGGSLRLARSSVSRKPRSTKRWRICSTVCTRQEKASAIRSSVQFGPLASALSSTWARRTFWLDPLSFLTTS